MELRRKKHDTLAHKHMTSLISSAEPYRAIFEQAALGIACIYSDGDWIAVNEKLCQIIGYTREELFRMTLLEITHPDDLNTDLLYVTQLLAGEIATYTIKKRCYRKEGSLIWIRLTASLVRDASGEPQYFIFFVEDITTLQRTEEALHQSNTDLERQVQEKTRELIHTNQEMEQFAYVVSHDLQEPLRMTGSYTQLLANRYRGKLDEKADRYIAYAVNGVTQMQAFLRDMLVYSRIGRQKITLEETNCNEVMDTVLTSLWTVIAGCGATVTRDALPTVQADRTLLITLFKNLIDNAMKYRGDKRPCVHISATRNDQDWLFTVKDNGMGIDPEFFEQIFVIFQRLHGRTEYAGTGAGLAICKRIVERHQGQIWVESVPESGTTFCFTLGTDAIFV